MPDVLSPDTPEEEQEVSAEDLHIEGSPEEEPESETGSPPEEEIEPTVTYTPGEPVEIVTLGTLQKFAYQDRIYTKRKAHGGGVNALSQEGDKLIVLPPDTPVQPITE